MHDASVLLERDPPAPRVDGLRGKSPCREEGEKKLKQVGRSVHHDPLAPLPNGSRLSCGRRARGRKELEQQTKKLASEATPFFPTCERPPPSSACQAAPSCNALIEPGVGSLRPSSPAPRS